MTSKFDDYVGRYVDQLKAKIAEQKAATLLLQKEVDVLVKIEREWEQADE